MSSMLSRFIRRQGKNLEKHGPKMLGVASLLPSLGISNPLLNLFSGQLGKMDDPAKKEWSPWQHLVGGDVTDEEGETKWEPGTLGKFGKNFLGAEDDQANLAGLGFGLQTLGTVGQFGSGYDKGTLNTLNRQLNPLMQAQTSMKDLAKGYMDPNSAMHQQMRSAIRGDELTAMSDVMDRAVSQSTGTYGDASQANINMNALADAVARGLGQYSGQLGKAYDTGAGLMTQSSNLANAIAQARTQNMLMAQQKAQMPWQYLGQTGYGLMEKALAGK